MHREIGVCSLHFAFASSRRTARSADCRHNTHQYRPYLHARGVITLMQIVGWGSPGARSTQTEHGAGELPVTSGEVFSTHGLFNQRNRVFAQLGAASFSSGGFQVGYGRRHTAGV